MRLLLLLLAAAQVLSSASVEGVVTNAVDGSPVRKALVTLRGKGNSGYQVLTGPDGKFRIENIAAGKYELNAEAPRFVRDFYRYYAPASSIRLAEKDEVKGRSIQLVPLASVSGLVVNEAGEPIPGAEIGALRPSYTRGVRRLTWQTKVTADDRGQYRLDFIDPGIWYLETSKAAPSPSATGRIHSSLPEQGFATAKSEPLELAPGVETTFDITLRKTRLFHIRGKVKDASVSVRVQAADGGYVLTRADSTFDIMNVAPGSYQFHAETRGDSRMFSPAREINVTDRDVENIEFRLAPAITLTGTVMVDGASLDAIGRAAVALEFAVPDSNAAQVALGEGGAFSIPNLAPRLYRAGFNGLPESLYIKSIRFGDRDISDNRQFDLATAVAPLTIVLGSDPGVVEGKVRTDGKQPYPLNAALVPDGRYAGRQDLMQSVEVEDDGTFVFEHVAPGEYKLSACETSDPGLPQFADFLKLVHGKVVAVTVRAGQHTNVAPEIVSAAEVQEALKKLR